MANEIDRLVLRVYDSIGNPDEWQKILDDISESLGVIGATILSVDRIQLELNLGINNTRLVPNFNEFVRQGWPKLERHLYEGIA